MSDNQKDEPTLSMKVLKGPKQIEREKTETIWDRFERLQRRLAPLREANKLKGEFIVSEELASRDPEPSDLVKICKALNEQGAKYVVIGGMAMVLHGFNRGTEDIDLLVDKVASNISLLKKALSILPDNAFRDVLDSDVEKYEVVRVADEVVVDLMGVISL